MGKKLKRVMLFMVVAVGLCLSISQSSNAALYTSIYLDCDLIEVAAFQVDILAPVDADVSSFTSSFPGGWIDMSIGKTVNGFDGSGSTSLPVGIIGVFDQVVELGGWALGDQSATSLIENVDFQIIKDGADYRIGCPVPIPGAFILLGSGLLGLVAIRRRKK